MGAALSAMDRVGRRGRRATFCISFRRYDTAALAFGDTDGRCSSAQQVVQWFPPAARVPAASGAAAAALRQLAAELLYVCAVEAQRCSLTPQRMRMAPRW